MKQRIISAFFGIILFFIVILSPSAVLDVAVVVLMEIAVYEMASALKIKDSIFIVALSMIFPPLLMIAIRFFDNFSAYYVYAYLMLMLLSMVFNHEKCKYTSVALLFASTVYISYSFIFVAQVRKMDFGILCLMLIFIGSWITDTCAYFAGRAFGKHKLAPKLSPKKTIEGSIGGVIGTTVIITLFALTAAKIRGNISVNIVYTVILGIICAVLSQLGDLCASAIKRENDIKDYGNIMPGHGGVMDRFDSVLFTAPAVYFFLSNLPIFFVK